MRPTVLVSPAVDDQPNTFDYPILSTVTLTCMVNFLPSSSVTYQWSTQECYTNINYNGGAPRCFSHGQTTQNVTDYVTAEDAGEFRCTVYIHGVSFNSVWSTLQISGWPILSLFGNFNCILYIQALQ